MRLGCIGIGSNAIRLLVAGWKNGQAYAHVRRERRGTRLFAGSGRRRADRREHAVFCGMPSGNWRAVRVPTARRRFLFLPPARCATRQTAAIFTARCEAVCGAKVEIVSGEEEAVLSYIGASDGGECGMIDIGGGSTEFTLGDG